MAGSSSAVSTVFGQDLAVAATPLATCSQLKSDWYQTNSYTPDGLCFVFYGSNHLLLHPLLGNNLAGHG